MSRDSFMPHKMSALQIGFLKNKVDGAVLQECACALGTECTPFSTLGDNIDYCNSSEVPRAICFEKLGIVVHRATELPAAAVTIFSEVLIESGFQFYEPPHAGFLPGKGAVNDIDDAPAEVTSWALRETGVLECDLDGSGISVCLIDSGVEPHPDIDVSPGNTRSFTQGTSTGDELGHGTFNAGIICGAMEPVVGPRFGVAPKAKLFVAKVFGPGGRACTMSLLAAIEWALQKKCEIISMSLAKPALGSADPRDCIARAAQRALELNTLLIAGSGNDSNRQHKPPLHKSVSFPANCAGVMAVGALQRSLQMTNRSNGRHGDPAASIDVVAPGAEVRSAGLLEDYTTLPTGTSVATPFVAGVAALYAQACKQARGQALWDLVVAKARRLPHLSVDEAGAGIVRAPVRSDQKPCEYK